MISLTLMIPCSIMVIFFILNLLIFVNVKGIIRFLDLNLYLMSSPHIIIKISA